MYLTKQFFISTQSWMDCVMSEHNRPPAAAEARDHEYVELVQLILQSTWRPGDLVRTAAGTIWQFRPVSYTSDFPEASEGPGSATAGGDVNTRNARRPVGGHALPDLTERGRGGSLCSAWSRPGSAS